MNPTAAAILTEIRRFIHANGYSPSIREVQQALGISTTSVVAYHLRQLQAAGELQRGPHGTSRSIVLPQAERANAER